MLRKIITIDAEKCTGCGLCVEACHEGAIGMRNGKAALLRDDYCDGLGDCLPVCPADAITFEERETLPYDEKAVRANLRARTSGKRSVPAPLPGGCPGRAAHTLSPLGVPGPCPEGSATSRLAQWPVQLQLAPVSAPFFGGADILLAAHCTAFSRADFHESFMRGRVTLIACPKLDAFDHAAKLGEILKTNAVRSLTVARMSVPCCGGLEAIARKAVSLSGKDMDISVSVIGTDGSLFA